MHEVCEGMVVRTLEIDPADVVFVKGVVEASDGLAAVFAEHVATPGRRGGGELTIAAPLGREAELARLLDDLSRELCRDGQGSSGGVMAEGLAPVPAEVRAHA